MPTPTTVTSNPQKNLVSSKNFISPQLPFNFLKTNLSCSKLKITVAIKAKVKQVANNVFIVIKGSKNRPTIKSPENVAKNKTKEIKKTSKLSIFLSPFI